jgi:hypothetical protein
MPAKSKTYEIVDIAVNNAHIWHSHVLNVYKRSNNVLHLEINDGRRYLVNCEDLLTRNKILNILINGVEDEICND